jgi:hypothetical protein
MTWFFVLFFYSAVSRKITLCGSGSKKTKQKKAVDGGRSFPIWNTGSKNGL